MVRKSVKVAALLSIAVLAWSFFYQREIPATQKTAGDAPGVEQNITSFSIEGRSPKGASQWNLDGDSAKIVGDDIHLDNIKAVVHSEESVINLLSDSGIYKKAAAEVELTGNVQVFSGQEFLLLTESARWSHENKQIFTDEVVTISREGMNAVGKGGSANAEEKWARLNSEVSVSIPPDTTIKSDGPLEVRYEDNIAVFYDNVIVEDKEGWLMADMLTVEFDPTTKKLARVTAEGNVKVKKGNTYTLSEKAVYTEGTKSAQLLGRPRIVIDPAEIESFDKMGI